MRAHSRECQTLGIVVVRKRQTTKAIGLEVKRFIEDSMSNLNTFTITSTRQDVKRLVVSVVLCLSIKALALKLDL